MQPKKVAYGLLEKTTINQSLFKFDFDPMKKLKF